MQVVENKQITHIMMYIFTVKKFSEQTFTVSDESVKGCYRNAVLTDENGNEDYEIVLTGSDALIPLEVGQQVLADLGWDSYLVNGEWHDEYYVLSIKPLEKNSNIDFINFHKL